MFISRISIKPSIYDINNAKGLCGVPSVTKDTSDDFMHRELGTVLDYKSFADSWRINSTSMTDESLFIPEPEFLHKLTVDTGNITNNTSPSNERYCVCEKQASPSEDFSLFYSLQCNLTESTETCSSAQQVDDNTISPFVTTCVPGYYRVKRSTEHRLVRRSLSDTDDISDVKPLEFDDDSSVDVEILEFRNGWTEEEANQTCYERIENGIPTDLFGEVTGLSVSDYIESCILDIKLTADTSFVQDTVGAMQTYTIMEVLRNETMAKTKTENGSQTILEYVTSLLCPNNCSNNGNCTSGSCTCLDGYIGEDCSKDMTVPPANTSLPTSGLCSTRTRACERTNIYGFFPSRNVWCNKTHYQINGDSITYADTVIVKAEYRNSFMVSVALHGNRRKRSTLDPVMAEGYELSLSNDGIVFGDAVNLIIYDDDCYDCNASSISCVVVDSCPDFTTTDIHTTTGETETSHVTTETLKSTTRQDSSTLETTSEKLTTSDVLTSTKHITTRIEETTFDSVTTPSKMTTSFKPDQGSTLYDTTTYEKTTIATTSISFSSPKQLKTSIATTDTTIIDTTSDETTTYKEPTTTDESTTADQSTTKDEVTYEESTTIAKTKATTDKTTTDKTTTAKITTIDESTTKDAETSTHETNTYMESTTTDKTDETTTSKELTSTSKESTTTVYMKTTYKKLSTTYETTTDYNMIDVNITNLVTSTLQMETTDGSTVIQTSEDLLPDTNKVISYIVPMFIGGSLLLIIVICCAILLIRLILKRSNERKQENIENTSQVDSLNIYTRRTYDETKNEDKLARPDFVHASRINTRHSVSSISSNTYNQRNFFEDYCQPSH
ncbi:uncharacterized protein LOC143069213 [Mytilus galloprovincialis]|uniref:uncharacterized protein LOC143069213 n=1 Tax=Mytilus galloprovincialis TaxID=29158 RepID=UPI003F7C4EED